MPVNIGESFSSDSAIEKKFTALSAVLGAIAAVIGMLVLIGWVFNDPVLKGINHLYVTMKANTAIAFICAGASLLLLIEHRPRSVKYRAGLTLAFVVLTLGLICIAQDVFNVQVGIDQLLFKDAAFLEGTVSPGRMSPNTSVCFIFLAVSLLLLDSRRNKLFIFGRLLAFLAGLTAFTALVGYFYGVRDLLGIQKFTMMSLYGAFGFFILFLGVISARPGRGLMKDVSADNPGGLMLRYSIPSLTLLMTVLGWAMLNGERRNFFDNYFGASLFTVIRVIIVVIILFVISKTVNKLYRERMEKEKSLGEIESKYREIMEVDRLKTQFIAVISHELRTPLTIIKGFSSILRMGNAGVLNKEQSDYVNTIENNTARLGNIISEMTDISRIESGSFTLEKAPCSMKELIECCVRDLSNTAPNAE